MAKGQMRSGKEARKPKKDKVAPAPEKPFGNQVKLATGGNNAPRGKN
ncbi:hypothetical protein M2360_001899 [Rhizobium sp. SG_E_25_P2]|jgi:hypothetical protein|nr:hypothetical protein [Rhizobium sp. SG_E_25_P2]MDH6266503.1 hypothetical protein [Rhizobium sp. SG_E_25_P2]